MRENEFRAKCPVHQGKSNTSLSIRNAGDRVLIYCHAGCSLQSILQAFGMKSAADLFDLTTSKRDPEIGRQARIRRGLEIWCERRLIHVCEQLRDIDARISLASGSLARYEDGRMPRDPVTEDQLLEALGSAYRVRTDYEQEFEILQRGDLQAKYTLFRALK